MKSRKLFTLATALIILSTLTHAENAPKPPPGMIILGGSDTNNVLSPVPNRTFFETFMLAYPKRPYLEPPHPPGRPILFVPAGTTNVAAKKKVASSDTSPIIGRLGQITDGDKTDGAESYVELGAGVQWVQIDLGQVYAIYAVCVWHLYLEAYPVYKNVVVQLADDARFKTNVRTIFNNDHDNACGVGKGKDYEYIEDNYGKLIDAKGLKARYVRLYSKGNISTKLNHYVEVEVFGTVSR